MYIYFVADTKKNIVDAETQEMNSDSGRSEKRELCLSFILYILMFLGISMLIVRTYKAKNEDIFLIV